MSSNDNINEEKKFKWGPKCKFTEEELKVFKECNKESFYQRSLPLSTVFGLTTYFAIKQGYLKQNARLGVFPKVTIAVVAGFFIGRFSYRNICKERLMQLPNSPMAEKMRNKCKKRGTEKESLTNDSLKGAGDQSSFSSVPITNLEDRK